ncbi:MAG: tRNA pseudouridine(13) synthase TruD, partial [Xanthomonadales bacterium]|nr:tRNA pseudouridine(13) synthase TruD [Xanthomonadales bacterium]
RLGEIAAEGVPNYFGPQRFGNYGSNLRAAMARGRLPRQRRSLALSAARAFLFNAVLGERVAAGCWDRGLSGEVWMPRGSRGIFGPDADPVDTEPRCRNGEIDPTGPLWGRDTLATGDAVRELEQAVVGEWPAFAQFLERAGLRQERRRLRLVPGDLAWSWMDGDLELRFALEPGAFATTVLSELGAVQPPAVTS